MKVFISSTFRDLEKEREKLHISLIKAGLQSLGMEFFVAEPNTPKEVCLREIKNSDLVLLIITDCYGSKDEETQKSYTHLEFEAAQEAKIEILGFLQKYPQDEDVKKFQMEVKNSGLTIDSFDNINEIWTAIFPALFKYVISKGLIHNKIKTFNDFAQFYARSSQKGSFFNYSQTLFGRQKELTFLEAFLSDENQQITIISAAGGIGKSKLVYEFAQKSLNNTDWNFRFVPWQVEFDKDSIRELPAQKTCVIIEDAHKQEVLDTIIYSLINSFPYDIKIIITIRPSGLEPIQKTLREYAPITPLELGPLSRDDSIKLSKSILTNGKQQCAETICRAANGITLVIVMASELIQKDQLDGALINDGIFKNKVLDKLLDELKIENRGINLDRLLATIAGLSPLNYDTNTLDLLSQFFSIKKYDLEIILDDLQKQGFIVRIGNRLRVVPDILADYILYKNSVNIANEPNDFINLLLEKFGRDYLGNLLMNVAELEYHVGEGSVNLTDNIWAMINERVKKCNTTELCSLLATVEPVSYFAPDKVYEIASNILNGKTSITVNENEKTDICQLSSIVKYLVSIFSRLARRPEFTKRSCLKLWNILTEQELTKLLDKFTESPSSVLQKIASFDNKNSFPIQKEAIEAVKAILKDKQYIGYESELCGIIESSLKPEIESNSYSNRIFSIEWFCTYEADSSDAIKKLTEARNESFELYGILIDNIEERALLPIINNLIKKLRMPYLRRHKVTDKAKIEFEREAIKANGLLKKIIAKNVCLLNNYIFEMVSRKEEKLLDSIHICDVISEEMKSDYDIFYCIRHDWPQNYHDDFDVRNKLFNEMQEQTAKQLWKRCGNNPGKLIDFIQNYRDLLVYYGIPCDNFAFLRACAKVKPRLCPRALEVILKQNKDNYAASMINTWLQYSSKSQQFKLSKLILKNGNSCHRRSLAQSLTQFSDMTESELVEVIECLSKDSEQEVIDATIRGLGVVCYHRKIIDELPRVVNVICNYDTQDDQSKLEALLGNFNYNWISPAVLGDDQISLILEKIKRVKKLGSQYDTGAFLSYIIVKKPLECIKLFLWRIQNIGSDDGQAFPYNEGFDDKPKDMVDHPEYHLCILEILNAMKEYDWRVYFWCPTVVRWLDPAFTEKTKEILLESLDIHSNALKAITCIFIAYKSEFFFNNIDFINQLLIQASKLSSKEEDTTASIKGKLTFMPFSGARCISGLGEHDSLCLDIIEKSKTLLGENPNYPAFVKKFYESLIKAAEYEDQGKLKRDAVELQEEEF